MKLLSVVYGISNSGKSTTLINLYNLLIQEPRLVSNAMQVMQPFPSDIDHTILKFIDNNGKGINVGIASAGDTEGIINQNFDFFFKKIVVILHFVLLSLMEIPLKQLRRN